ncbi:PREDICTED: uncharacterized protein LOC101310673 [Fragaria vesca subsp. vesca]
MLLKRSVWILEVEMTNMVDELDAIMSKLTDTSYARRETCKGRIRRWSTSVIDHQQNEVSISVGYILLCFVSLSVHILRYSDLFASNPDVFLLEQLLYCRRCVEVKMTMIWHFSVLELYGLQELSLRIAGIAVPRTTVCFLRMIFTDQQVLRTAVKEYSNRNDGFLQMVVDLFY